jgi:hypothetical protein
MPKLLNLGDQGIQVNLGGAMQGIVPPTVHGLPATIASSGNATSNLIFADGLQLIAIGLTSSQTGVLTVQRYLDDAGSVPQGAPITANLTANTAGTLNILDGVPYATFTVAVSNTGGSTANLTNLAILLQAGAGGGGSGGNAYTVE